MDQLELPFHDEVVMIPLRWVSLPHQDMSLFPDAAKIIRRPKHRKNQFVDEFDPQPAQVVTPMVRPIQQPVYDNETIIQPRIPDQEERQDIVQRYGNLETDWARLNRQIQGIASGSAAPEQGEYLVQDDEQFFLDTMDEEPADF